MKLVPTTGEARRQQPGCVPFYVFMGVLLALLAPAPGVAQFTWTNINSTVVGPGTGWDSSWVNFVSVIYEDSQYVMWYSGGDNTNGVNLSVGRATSPDGNLWRKDTLNPVMQHNASSWDGLAAWVPKVLKIGKTYTMWFTGALGGSHDVWQIGRATSPDGRAWAQDTTNPVLRVGAPGQWDAALVHTGSVLFDGTTYRMWYTGMSQGYGSGSAGIGLATSADGIHWVKDTLDNPVLASGAADSWDAHGVGQCSVVYDSVSQRYLMFYDGNEVDFFQQTSGIGYAFSADGIHWTKYSGNPVLRNVPPISFASVATAPFVLLRDSTFHMWYTYGPSVGYATSPRVLTGVAEQSDAFTVGTFQLQQNYPNPFNPSTVIRFSIPASASGAVTLRVYNLLGQEVKTLVNDRLQPGGYETTFDATGLASGAYFYRLTAGNLVTTKRLMVIR